MTKLDFSDWLNSLYGSFGKAKPQPHVLESVYKRVETLPDGFFAFAMERLEDRDSLPANLGFELRRNLWSEYLQQNPSLLARHAEQVGCDNCRNSRAPGMLWAKDATGHVYAFPCVCNATPSLAHLKHWTRAQLFGAGFSLDVFSNTAPADDSLAFSRPKKLQGLGEIVDVAAKDRTRHLPAREREAYAETMAV